MANEDKILLEINNLRKYFPVKGGFIQHTLGYVQAVDDVSFTIPKGKVLGLVGESGCGKSTAGRTILGLTPATQGQVLIDGVDVCTAAGDTLHKLRRKMQIIFQDPYSSLDPRMTVYDLIGEGLLAHKLVSSRTELEERVEAVMKSLEEKNKSIRFILGKKVGKQMRIVPELRFFVDDSLDYIDKIDELLK